MLKNFIKRIWYGPGVLLSKEKLEKLPDGKLEQRIFDHILGYISQVSSSEQDGLEQLTQGQQMLYSTMILEKEVKNGGFAQFFYNHSKALFEATYKGLEMLGLADYKKLFREVYKIAKMESERQEKLAKEGKALTVTQFIKKDPFKNMIISFIN